MKWLGSRRKHGRPSTRRNPRQDPRWLRGTERKPAATRAERPLGDWPAPPREVKAPALVALLPWLAQDLTFVEIGARIGLSESTVRRQAASIYRLLGANSRHAAVLRWLLPNHPSASIRETSIDAPVSFNCECQMNNTTSRGSSNSRRPNESRRPGGGA